jgi:predicted DsbA family dithiol-disulfide isomerase
VAVQVRYYTDPACPDSWANEPSVRALMAEFGESLSWTYVMGGLARDFSKDQGDLEAGIEGTQPVYRRLYERWLDAGERSGMPVDPRLWSEGPIGSTYPACMAAKAAAEQAPDGGYAYLRALREGLFCFRRKLDTTEALVEAARAVRLDVERFRIDLGSHAIVEAFGADLEEVRDPPDEARGAGQVVAAAGRERLALPSAVFVGGGGSRSAVYGPGAPYERYREAAQAAGAEPAPGSGRPAVLDALRRFGRMAAKEVETVCGLPGPRAHAELWRLAVEWQVRPVPVLTGHLWELA